MYLVNITLNEANGLSLCNILHTYIINQFNPTHVHQVWIEVDGTLAKKLVTTSIQPGLVYKCIVV